MRINGWDVPPHTVLAIIVQAVIVVAATTGLYFGITYSLAEAREAVRENRAELAAIKAEIVEHEKADGHPKIVERVNGIKEQLGRIEQNTDRLLRRD